MEQIRRRDPSQLASKVTGEISKPARSRNGKTFSHRKADESHVIKGTNLEHRSKAAIRGNSFSRTSALPIVITSGFTMSVKFVSLPLHQLGLLFDLPERESDK